MQPIQLTETGLTSGQPNANPVDTSQGAANPNQGVFDQTHHGQNVNHEFVEQNSQANNFTSNDLNFGLVEPNHQATNFANNNAGPNQADGANLQTPTAADDQNQAVFGAPLQTQAEFNMANGWEDFGFGNDQSSGNMEFDWTVDPNDAFAIDFINQFQGLEQPAIQDEQPAIQAQQPIQQQHQEQAGQQQSGQNDPLQQDLDGDLFGDLLTDAQFAADMQALANFPAQK